MLMLFNADWAWFMSYKYWLMLMWDECYLMLMISEYWLMMIELDIDVELIDNVIDMTLSWSWCKSWWYFMFCLIDFDLIFHGMLSDICCWWLRLTDLEVDLWCWLIFMIDFDVIDIDTDIDIDIDTYCDWCRSWFTDCNVDWFNVDWFWWLI